MPLTTLVTTAAGHPAGEVPTAPVTTGEIVSSTVRLVIVAPPMFVTTRSYFTGAPAHAPPWIVFCTCTDNTGGGTAAVIVADTAAVAISADPHVEVPFTLAVKLTTPDPEAESVQT